MKGIMDVIMTIGFVLFMVWIIKGYHANKYEERYGENGTEVKKKDEPQQGGE
ncbi:hypothetical protein [Hydrogenimonas cancrithermarum]|uniref:Uncharacterized protein n=1 Tax=Hydrogenimonas cancrithermarum TaxID=2993563 RepID=A0ABM8FJI9_9BACT|nr:hypothetical protein [Hydrogenimonas cancrithermarum]BDY11780.1 hypothetical protein HCR_00920 [Hydrogenimonas cancrithermarum]